MADVNSLFRRFEANLRMSPDTVGTVQKRYHTITQRLNQDFWEINSDMKHSWYAGSYGRGTAISTSDIDIYVELPSNLYYKYELSTALGSNGPSSLLQQVKTTLQRTYPSTRLRGDGQVVVIDFADEIRFEVVPVFADNISAFIYPDTHNGGSWQKMQPKLELQAFAELARQKPGGLKKFCRMLRAWNAKSLLKLQGQVIDAMAYEYWQTNEYSNNTPYLYFDWHTRDFFAYWYNQFQHKSNRQIVAPGSHRHIEVSITEPELEQLKIYKDIGIKAVHANTLEAPKFWRLIYGDKFPSA